MLGPSEADEQGEIWGNGRMDNIVQSVHEMVIDFVHGEGPCRG